MRDAAAGETKETPHRQRTGISVMSRRNLQFLACILLYLPSLGVSQEDRSARSPQQRPTNFPTVRGDSAYHLQAGSSTLKDIGGGRVLELKDGVEIVHGDVTIRSRRGLQYARKRVTYLIGDVTIDQNDLHMEGEEGEYRRFRDQAILRDNVRIIDRGWEIFCDEATFYRKSELAWLKGNVVARDSVTTLRADSLYYDKGRLVAEAFGRVRVANEKEGFTVNGRHGFYYRDRGQGVIDDTPRLVIQSGNEEPTFVDSDTISFFPDEREAVALGRVKIIKGSTITQCDSAVVFDRENRAVLYGNPLAKQENVSMAGRRMVLVYNDEEVNQIRIDGDASIVESQSDSLVIGRDNWIRGDTMLLHVRTNRVDSLHVVGNSSSEYYPNSEKRVEKNFVKGEKMFFVFDGDTISYVNIIGGAEGLYRYIDLEPNTTVDSLRSVRDTLLRYIPFDANAEKVVYKADTIDYYAKERDLVLIHNASLVYQNRTLLGDQITYNSTFQLLDAVGKPVLIEGQDKFYGEQMDYDLDVGIGLVRQGSTKFMQGFYQGRRIAKVGDKVLKVWNSTYTTCNLETPHYHFASNQMKIYINDKVVSGPIALYIGETPIAFLPFLANNLQRDRKSGILRPDFEFGITSRSGRFIRNFGYFWATNDYTDLMFVGDFNEDASLRLLIDNRYRKRYSFDGGVNLSLFRNLRDFRNEWTVSSHHSQTLGEKFSLTSDLRFVSSDRAPRAVSQIDEVADVIDRRIESRVSLRKSWNTIGFSTSARRVQNLDITDPNLIKVSTELPNVSLSIPSRSLYFGKKSSGGKKSFWERFLGGIRYSPGASFNRTTQERLNDLTETMNANLSLNFSSPWRIGFLNVSPSLNTSNRYTRTVTEVYEHVQDTTLVPSSRDKTDDNQFSWSTGARANTNLYGTFYPRIGILEGFRHTLSPAVGYSYRPEIGGRPSSQSFSVSLNNVLDLKVRDGEDVKKLSGVFIWGLSSSYNPQATSGKGWSTISSRVNLRIFGTTLSMSQSIDPYLFEVQSTQITSSISLNGTHMFGSAEEAAESALNIVAQDTSSLLLKENAGEKTPDADTGETGLPWSLAASFSYSKSQSGDPRSTLNLNGNIQLTRSWRITYSANYDIQDRELLGKNYGIRRDLHCWEMSFNRQKLGDEWEFYFRINLKAHPEIYSESGRRGLGGGGFGVPFRY
jgi:lipopolysaccharide assembly outer membrane protein LptD (OstA)